MGDQTLSNGMCPPDGWTVLPLENLLEHKGLAIGVMYPGAHDPAGVPIIRVKNMQGGRIVADDVLRVKKDVEAKHPGARLQGGEVLLSLVGSVGRVAIAPKEAAGWNTARAVAVMRVGGQVSNQWVKLWLESPAAQAHIESRLNTTVQSTLNLRDVRRIPVVIPPRKDLTAIVAVASALDDKVAVNERIANTVEPLCLALLSEGLWSAKARVDAIADLHRTQLMPSELDQALVAHYSLPAYDSGRMPDLVSPQSIKSSKFFVDEPAVLLSKLNPNTPRVWRVIPDARTAALASTEFLVLKPKGEVRTGELWAVLSQPTLSAELAAKVTGTSKSHQRVRPAEVMSSEVVDPRAVRASVRTQVIELAGRVARARDESRALAALRNTLLPQLMSGKLRVRDAERIAEDAV